MIVLTKLSKPGWEKVFILESDAFDELEKHICDHCFTDFVNEYNREPQTLQDLLWTGCGAEFMMEEENAEM